MPYTKRGRWFRSSKSSEGSRIGNQVIYHVIPLGLIAVYTGNGIGLEKTAEVVVLVVVSSRIETNGRFPCPVQGSTLVGEYGVGIDVSIGYDDGLICVIL